MAGVETKLEIPLEVRQSQALFRKQSKMKIIDEANVFAQRVSLVGLTHALNSKASKGRRIVWMIWLVFGLGLAIYQIQDRIMYYCSYPYNTEFQIKTAKELRFPQVTVCKEDWMSKSKVVEFGIDEIFRTRLQLIEDLLSGDNWTEYNEQLEQLNIRLHNSTRDWDTLSKNISHGWEELVTLISWNGDYNRSIVEEIETDLGHCFTISSDNKPLTVTEPGIRSGLELHLNARQSDSVFASTSSHDIFTGFRLLIHDPYEVPRMLEAGFVISPGTVTQVAVSFENITQLGPPYSDCDTDPYYRVVNCLAICEDDFFLNNCNCKPFYYIDSDNDTVEKPICSLFAHEECLEKFQASRKTSENCSCSQQCHGRMYGYSLSQSKISKEMLRFFEKIFGFVDRAKGKNVSSADENNAEHDLTSIYIYFPNLMYKDITSVASYSFLMLLCDVGGALSLLLGATLLTVYEVAEFLALVARDFLCGGIRN